MQLFARLLSLVILVFFFAAPAFAAPAQAKRVALIIGNGSYPTAPLKNPVNDATDMDAALKRLGFETMLLKNATMQQMETAVREFGLKLRSGGLGLFYYAGHGVQVGGENYLVPVNAIIQTEGDVRYGCLPAGLVLAKMEDARNGVNVVVLDACRNNPFGRGFRSAEQGLAEMRAPTGSLIAYATAPGKVAADGSGRNGLYTQHLLRNIVTPGLSVTDMFMNVREAVVRDSGRKQVPWENTSLIGRFSFAGGTQVASLGPMPNSLTSSLPAVTAPQRPGSGTVDLSDINAEAAAQARLDAAARKDWDARLKAMQADFATVQKVEKSGKYAAAHKAKAWERFLETYPGENPFTDQDQALRAKARDRVAHWAALAGKSQPSPALAPAAKQGAGPGYAAPAQPLRTVDAGAIVRVERSWKLIFVKLSGSVDAAESFWVEANGRKYVLKLEKKNGDMASMSLDGIPDGVQVGARVFAATGAL